MENPSFLYNARVLSSNCYSMRNKGSSGGVVTQIIKYLFDSKQIKSSISFEFFNTELFKPILIHSFNDYNQCGSIYHDINLFKFLKDNIHNIRSPILITCLPCQIVPIKRLLINNNLDGIFISLVCSAQLSKEATYYFLDKNNIELHEIEKFRYRGNGWPSGINIKTKDSNYFFHNNTSKWKYVFHSQIFTLNRCFSCKDTFGIKADLSIADPWIKRYIETDKVGSSVVIAHSHYGENIINSMLQKKFLCLQEVLTDEEVLKSQRNTIVKKHVYLKHRKLIKFFINIFRNNLYKKYFYHYAKIHHWFFRKLIKFLTPKDIE